VRTGTRLSYGLRSVLCSTKSVEYTPSWAVDDSMFYTDISHASLRLRKEQL